MVNFADLKKKRAEMSKKVLDRVKQEEKGFSDERFWSLTPNKEGFGRAIIRFLPAGEQDDAPFVKRFTHAFKGKTGQWYIENCLTTIGKTDPVVEYNNKIWATKDEALIKANKSRSRKTEYISNILVVKDPANPENDGKVFLFKYGKKLYAKIIAPLTPRFDDDPQYDPFDFWEGANFQLTLTRSEDDTAEWTESKYMDQSELFDGDDKQLEEVYNKLYHLGEFVDPNTAFKSYETLAARLKLVDDGESIDNENHEDGEPESTNEDEVEETKPEIKPSTKSTKPSKPAKKVEEEEDEEDVDFSTLG